jgi:hypothetical protein
LSGFGLMRSRRASDLWRPRVAARDKRQLQQLLHQQMWCWGRDVHAVPENLLLRYGMTCSRPNESTGPGSNRYSGHISETAVIYLWAFGVAVIASPAEAIFQHRYDRRPWLIDPRWCATSVHRPEQVLCRARPRSPSERSAAMRLQVRLFLWIEQYERWVTQTMGSDYRQKTLERWEHPVVEGSQMAAAWKNLATAHRKAIPAVLSILNSFHGVIR